MSIRSTTGCLTCKSRKKKCDETHPKCRRCAESNRECGGYAPLANPDSRGVMRRVKTVLPRPETDKVSTLPLQIVSWPSKGPPQSHTHTLTFNVNVSTIATQPTAAKDRPFRNTQGYLEIVDARPPYSSHQSARRNSGSLLDYLPNRRSPPNVTHRSPPSTRRNIPDPPTSPYPAASRPATTSPAPLDSQNHPPRASNNSPPSTVARRYSPSVTQAKQSFTPGQASLFEALLSLGDSEPVPPKASSPSPASLVPRVTYGPSWPPPNIRSKTKEPSATVDHDDPEGFQPALCRTLAPDPNTRDNSLAFVLQSYACWIKSNVFDPMKVVDAIRECIIEQFAGPQELRTRIILLSNVMGSLDKSSRLNIKSLSLISTLRIETHQTMQRFRSTKPTGQHIVDKLEATKTLDHTIETLLFQRFTGSLHTVIKLMQETAPVFRRARPEFPERVNLASALLESNLHLRHFGAIDVLFSVSTGRPMLFKYDVSYTPEMADQMMQGHSGIQWLYGVPDQFIILLAWINVLSDDFGNAVDPQHILDVEKHIRNVKIAPPAVPADPQVVVWRFIVQECWRQVVYIYLYMMLCGDQADDPRVVAAVKACIRLVDRVRSTRNPDSFLFFPLMITGAAAHNAEDRNFIHRRMQNLRECALPSTCGHECLLILNDIWERTEAENRPAVWRDLRIASLKVAGV